MYSNSKTFKYKAADCETELEISIAETYYQSIQDTILPGEKKNYQLVLESFARKRATIENKINLAILTEHSQKTRLDCFHRAVVLSVEFLQEYPDGYLLTELYDVLLDSLEIAGSDWDETTMYTDNVIFPNAFTAGEKKISFINRLLQSGLHAPKTIIQLINSYIKLVNSCEYVELINVELPNRCTLQTEDFTFQEFKY